MDGRPCTAHAPQQSRATNHGGSVLARHWLSGSSGALFHTSVVMARWGCGGKAARSIPHVLDGKVSSTGMAAGCCSFVETDASRTHRRAARALTARTSCVADDDGRASERLFVGTPVIGSSLNVLRPYVWPLSASGCQERSSFAIVWQKAWFVFGNVAAADWRRMQCEEIVNYTKYSPASPFDWPIPSSSPLLLLAAARHRVGVSPSRAPLPPSLNPKLSGRPFTLQVTAATATPPRSPGVLASVVLLIGTERRYSS
nr:unnamed protein product [Digitaria exilis]